MAGRGYRRQAAVCEEQPGVPPFSRKQRVLERTAGEGLRQVRLVPSCFHSLVSFHTLE